VVLPAVLLDEVVVVKESFVSFGDKEGGTLVVPSPPKTIVQVKSKSLSRFSFRDFVSDEKWEICQRESRKSQQFDCNGQSVRACV
jgi:hypothetical protein